MTTVKEYIIFVEIISKMSIYYGSSKYLQSKIFLTKTVQIIHRSTRNLNTFDTPHDVLLSCGIWFYKVVRTFLEIHLLLYHPLPNLSSISISDLLSFQSRKYFCLPKLCFQICPCISRRRCVRRSISPSVSPSIVRHGC